MPKLRAFRMSMCCCLFVGDCILCSSVLRHCYTCFVFVTLLVFLFVSEIRGKTTVATKFIVSIALDYTANVGIFGLLSVVIHILAICAASRPYGDSTYTFSSLSAKQLTGSFRSPASAAV